MDASHRFQGDFGLLIFSLGMVLCYSFWYPQLFYAEFIDGWGAAASCKQNATLSAFKTGIYKDTSKITNITYNFRDILNLK